MPKSTFRVQGKFMWNKKAVQGPKMKKCLIDGPCGSDRQGQLHVQCRRFTHSSADMKLTSGWPSLLICPNEHLEALATSTGNIVSLTVVGTICKQSIANCTFRLSCLIDVSLKLYLKAIAAVALMLYSVFPHGSSFDLVFRCTKPEKYLAQTVLLRCCM